MSPPASNPIGQAIPLPGIDAGGQWRVLGSLPPHDSFATLPGYVQGYPLIVFRDQSNALKVAQVLPATEAQTASIAQLIQGGAP
jgi:hypothetical protein